MDRSLFRRLCDRSDKWDFARRHAVFLSLIHQGVWLEPYDYSYGGLGAAGVARTDRAVRRTLVGSVRAQAGYGDPRGGPPRGAGFLLPYQPAPPTFTGAPFDVPWTHPFQYGRARLACREFVV